MRLEFDEAADRRRAALLHRYAHAVRGSSSGGSIKALDTHYDAIAFLTLLADLHESRERDARDRMLQNRMRDTCGLQRGDDKPRSKRSKSQCDREANRAPASDTRGRDGCNS